jgi:hypothetical protein
MILVLNMRDPVLFRWSSILDPHTTNNIKTNYVTSHYPNLIYADVIWDDSPHVGIFITNAFVDVGM